MSASPASPGITARVGFVPATAYHAQVTVNTPTLARWGACPQHELSGPNATPTTGTAPCWRCNTEAPAIMVPASQQQTLNCDHIHRTFEAAEECGREMARKHGAKVTR